jgi:hypothetical protein
VTPFSSVEGHQRFGGTFCLHIQVRYLDDRNILPDHTESHLTWEQSLQSPLWKHPMSPFRDYCFRSLRRHSNFLVDTLFLYRCCISFRAWTWNGSEEAVVTCLKILYSGFSSANCKKTTNNLRIICWSASCGGLTRLSPEYKYRLGNLLVSLLLCFKLHLNDLNSIR